jgi:hypothetical protein
LCITPSFPSRASATAAVVLVVVSFSNLTDMAPQCYAAAADSGWAREDGDAAVDEVLCGGGSVLRADLAMAGDDLGKVNRQVRASAEPKMRKPRCRDL